MSNHSDKSAANKGTSAWIFKKHTQRTQGEVSGSKLDWRNPSVRTVQGPGIKLSGLVGQAPGRTATLPVPCNKA